MGKKIPENKVRDAELERQGWTRRFVTDEPRLSEVVELYKSIGYEVRLEPAVFDQISEECRKCLPYKDCDKYKTIYTRPKKKGRKGKEEAIVP
jgi:hypothetical protein